MEHAGYLGAGVGKGKARDNHALYGTDNEPRLRSADDPFYKKFAAECSRYQIAVDIFSFRYCEVSVVFQHVLR